MTCLYRLFSYLSSLRVDVKNCLMAAVGGLAEFERFRIIWTTADLCSKMFTAFPALLPFLYLLLSRWIPASMAVRLIVEMMSKSALAFSRGCG